jgi:hypothetical protein
VRGVERSVLVTALAVAALVFFRPTRPIGRVLLAVWLVIAWPLAWIWHSLGHSASPASQALRHSS